ncbi:MAG: beta-lactamase family protein [Deltaproteobacteria bacterium]|jgi:CubicO group peptidase (beta-lactamase class C family)|nr:beta-lactamase family protein [Deltaproteobacteria bacterium]
MDPICKPEDVGLSSARLELIQPWIQTYLDAGKLPGATIFVARHGKAAYCKTFGLRDVETNQPMQTDTILRFYSMTKPITAVALLMLYEEGHFQLDDPVAEFIPGFKDLRVYVSGDVDDMVTEPLCQQMTLHHLLTHTSGLTYGFGEEGPIPKLYQKHHTDFDDQDGPLEAVVERLAKIPLQFQPGKRWNYGVSFDVLGRVVEVVSGQPLDRFFQERIFKPLNMVDTGFAIPHDKVHRFASLYERIEEENLSLLEAPGNSTLVDTVETFSGGGGLVSTLDDYFRFSEMMRRKGQLDGARLLGRKTVEYMTCNHLPGDLADMGQPVFTETSYEGIGFGLGVSVMLDPARAKVMGSPGEYAWGGYASTAFWTDPREDMTVIFLTQLIPSSAYPIRRELRVLTYQALIG